MTSYIWHTSRKGNEFADIEGIHCVVGENKFGAFFGLVDEEFLPQGFASLDEAKNAVIDEALQRLSKAVPFEEFFREEL